MWAVGYKRRPQARFFRSLNTERGIYMIALTKLNGQIFTLNCNLIETITENPDTTIRLTNDKLYIVKETMQEVIDKTIEYKHRIYFEE